MSVPLNHKNHPVHRSSGRPWRYYLGRKGEYTIHRHIAALSSDGKLLVCVNPDYEGVFKVPDGVETIGGWARKRNSRTSAFILPDSYRRCYLKDYYTAYKSRKTVHPVLGTAYVLTARQLVFCCGRDFVEKKEKEFSSQRVPGAIKPYLFVWNDEYHEHDRQLCIDRFGVRYSMDGTRLEECPKELKKYAIPDGVLIIEFPGLRYSHISELVVPASIQNARAAFYGHVKTVRILGPDTDLSDPQNRLIAGEELDRVYIPKGSMPHYSKYFEDCTKLIEV